MDRVTEGKMDWIEETFLVKKPAIGMIHLLPLPSAPHYDAQGGMEKILKQAQADLNALQDGGIDGVMFCNEHDRPYSLKADCAIVAAMAYVIGKLKDIIRLPFGVDVLWDPNAALAVAHATGASFVREIFTGVYASDMGLWNTDVGGAMRYKRFIGADRVRVLYNINAEFAGPLADRPLDTVARSVVFSSIPDGICISGMMTGQPVQIEDLQLVRENVKPVPVFINTGARRENIAQLICNADGVIVGSSLKVDGKTWNSVDPERVKTFMSALIEAREAE
jgi:membrane complex biogenesis BtpA family protein